MGEVVNTFMLRRVPVRYVELVRSKGVEAAKAWWHSIEWAPDNQEQLNYINTRILELSNK